MNVTPAPYHLSTEFCPFFSNDGLCSTFLLIFCLKSGVHSVILPCFAHDKSNSIGIALYSSEDSINIQPHTLQLVKTDISICCPTGTYTRISQINMNSCLHVQSGVLDLSFRGNIGILLYNMGEQSYQVQRGDHIAQLILENSVLHHFSIVKTFPTINDTVQTLTNQDTPNRTCASAAVTKDIFLDFNMPYNIYMTDNPYDNVT